MSRTQRLFDLLQILRRHRYPVSGEFLAQELRISLRTLYRDMGELRAQGADIEAEAGVGFVLRPGFMLPPLMLSLEEIEALALGAQWVAGRADKSLSAAATNALAKISAVLPDDVRDGLQTSGLMVSNWKELAPSEQEDKHLAMIRQAMRHERKLDILYSDVNEVVTNRVIWPVALGFWERARVLVAWCETRSNFRHFRSDRIQNLTVTTERYPRRRLSLLKDWRDEEACAQAAWESRGESRGNGHDLAREPEPADKSWH